MKGCSQQKDCTSKRWQAYSNDVYKAVSLAPAAQILSFMTGPTKQTNLIDLLLQSNNSLSPPSATLPLMAPVCNTQTCCTDPAGHLGQPEHSHF
eukprot:8984734-Ditylum_brightwellii.AAC.1